MKKNKDNAELAHKERSRLLTNSVGTRTKEGETKYAEIKDRQERGMCVEITAEMTRRT